MRSASWSVEMGKEAPWSAVSYHVAQSMGLRVNVVPLGRTITSSWFTISSTESLVAKGVAVFGVIESFLTAWGLGSGV